MIEVSRGLRFLPDKSSIIGCLEDNLFFLYAPCRHSFFIGFPIVLSQCYRKYFKKENQ